MEQENQKEKSHYQSLPPRSTIHHTKTIKKDSRFKWSALQMVLGSFIFVIIIAAVILYQLNGFPFSDKGFLSMLSPFQKNPSAEEQQSAFEETEDKNSEWSDMDQQPSIDDEISIQEENESDVSEEDVHIVQSGENLYRISLKYYQSGEYVEALAKYNGLDNPDQIYVGLQLKIPDKQTISQE